MAKLLAWVQVFLDYSREQSTLQPVLLLQLGIYLVQRGRVLEASAALQQLGSCRGDAPLRRHSNQAVLPLST